MVSRLGRYGRRLAALLLAGVAAGCAGVAGKDEQATLPLGLYQVVSRECVYALGAPEDCSRTRYLEFAQGVFRSLPATAPGMATWLADDPAGEHVFNIRDVSRGHFVAPGEYVIADGPLGREWLTVQDGEIRTYHFVRHARQTPQGEMAGHSLLGLRRVERTPALDRLLPYPPAVD